MALATIQFSRDTKVYLEIAGDIWNIPVLDGFSFSQATNSTELALNEMATPAGISRRGRKVFNDSVAPSEWSFSSYLQPKPGASAVAGVGAVEEALWAMFVSENSYDSATTKTWLNSVNKAAPADSTTIDFLDSNTVTLGTFNLYFVLGGCGHATGDYVASTDAVTIYKIADCVANTASIDFDIDGIGMVNWSGFGGQITDEATLDAQAAINSVPATDNFIRNRLTSLSVVGVAPFETSYTVILTGGNITFENNITFLTPDTLCTVNSPIGHVTGTRTITGNFTAYLNDTAAYSGELWEDLILNSNIVTNVFDLTFDIGGTGNDPLVTVNLPQCHLEVPTHQIEDVISLDTAFHALGSDVDTPDEATIIYYKAV